MRVIILRMVQVKNLLMLGGLLSRMSLMELFKVTPSGILCQRLLKRLIVTTLTRDLINSRMESARANSSWSRQEVDLANLNFLERLYGTYLTRQLTKSDLCFLKRECVRLLVPSCLWQ